LNDERRTGGEVYSLGLNGHCEPGQVLGKKSARGPGLKEKEGKFQRQHHRGGEGQGIESSLSTATKTTTLLFGEAWEGQD